MFLLFPHRPFERLLNRVPLIVSAALTALAVTVAADHPIIAVGLLLLSCGAVVPPVLARIRLRRLLRSGDVLGILDNWKRSYRDVPESGAFEPLMSAMAFAAYGWVDEARVQLQRARFQPQLTLNPEHMLFVETLIEAFDGDRSLAIQSADQIASLPVPAVGSRLQKQVVLLRSSLGALARAFARRSCTGDLEVLEQVAQTSPLVSWAMRYAAAIIAIDRQDLPRARSLIDGAPSWPEQSAFRAFHEEINDVLSRPFPPS